MIPLVKGISQHNILKLLDLRLMYVNKLEVTEFSYSNYQADKLKNKLQCDFERAIL